MLTEKLSRLFYHLIIRLLHCRLARDYEERHGPCEDSCAARIGPLRLKISNCFVMDHADASISLRLPMPGGQIRTGIMACVGEDPIRRPGLFYRRLRW